MPGVGSTASATASTEIFAVIADTLPRSAAVSISLRITRKSPKAVASFLTILYLLLSLLLLSGSPLLPPPSMVMLFFRIAFALATLAVAAPSTYSL